MRERFIFIFLFHLLAISMLLVPDTFQGPVVTAVFDVSLRVMDAAAVFLTLAGSVFLYISLFAYLKVHINQGEHLSGKAEQVSANENVKDQE